ncbi:hypothetical protein [Vreelandella zhanjiangensis]|uniref:hypothetical protein n=1 Tax=Vreelandella zhanjiangensis TaxID=1121960 RepID=UPI00037DE2E2|nr:hypothetical protein [Halomonas zhanjiangensis]
MDLSWLVCDAKHFAQMKKDLLAEETSNTEDPDLIAIVTPEEQLFIFEYGDKRASLFARYKERRYLSLNRKVLFCEVEERPRMSEVSFWENGVNVWGAYHYGDEDIYHLEENGKPPGNYYVIKKTLLQMQREQDSNGDEEVDHVYSLPLFQAKDLTGYGADTEMPQGKVYKWDCRPRPNAAMRFLNRLLRRH